MRIYMSGRRRRRRKTKLQSCSFYFYFYSLPPSPFFFYSSSIRSTNLSAFIYPWVVSYLLNGMTTLPPPHNRRPYSRHSAAASLVPNKSTVTAEPPPHHPTHLAGDTFVRQALFSVSLRPFVCPSMSCPSSFLCPAVNGLGRSPLV